MPDIFLDLWRVDYLTEQNVGVSAWRAHADVLFFTPGGGTVSYSCIVDNDLRLVLEGTRGQLIGSVSVP
jgi:hypothetical protein